MLAQDNHLKKLQEGCLNNNRQSQDTLYKLMAPKMLRVARQYAKDADDAQDILQDGMIKVFKNLSHYRGEGSFEGWIRRIIVHTAISRYRKLRPLMLVEDMAETAAVQLTVRNSNNLEMQDMMNMVDELPSAYRSVFNLYAIEGYSHQEISSSLGISELLSRTTLYRARGVLKDRITKLQKRENHRMVC